MDSFRNLSIKAKLSLILALVITIIMSLFGSLYFAATRKRAHTELKELSDMTAERLSKSLVTPLYDFDKQMALSCLRSEMIEKRVFAVIVREGTDKKVFCALKRDADWKPASTTDEITEKTILSQLEVLKGKEQLGAVEVYFTPKFLEKQLFFLGSSIFGVVLILILVLVVVNFFSIQLTLVSPISDFMKRLNESGDQVTSASSQVSSTSQQLAHGTSAQAASIEETSSSMEEMSSMTKQNADHAGQSDTLMKEAGHVVTQANDSMTQLTTSMDEILKASDETSKIIKTIDEIAFQTNLLALNAAVEAARAGEAGAGFAVVADEVRSLAMRAAEAARSTAGLIEQTGAKIKNGAELVNSTNEAFTKVTETNQKVAALISEIATASNEQARGIEQINTTVSEMEKVVQANAANAEESASAAEELDAQANITKKVISELFELISGKGRTWSGQHAASVTGQASMQKPSFRKQLT